MAEQISLAKFKVLMGEMNDAIGIVDIQVRIVRETLDAIEHDFRSASEMWRSPAADTFEPMRAEFKRSADDMADVLLGILHRMRITYQNYLDTERKAEQNLTMQSGS
ncbi:hypothetical protein AB0J83_20855 [Actinoplanes sp. NPDC049596]|uniref:WXG100 family type VII secretion target n=1 Tax=unclassified Actinoplanes TaxID=2626549 RepID=UPI00341916B5